MKIDLERLRLRRPGRSVAAIARLAELESRIRASDPDLTRRDCCDALTGGLLWDACVASIESDHASLRRWATDPVEGCWAVAFIDEATDDTDSDDLCPAAVRAADLVRMADVVGSVDGGPTTAEPRIDEPGVKDLENAEVSALDPSTSLASIVDHWRTSHLLPRGQATERSLPDKVTPRVREIAESVALLPGGSARTMACLQAHLLIAKRRRGRRRKAIRVLFEQRDKGISGTLEMEIVPGGPHGLFPDPRTMGMVTADSTFEDAITDAWSYVTSRRGTRKCVLWRLSIDGPWSLRIQHGSLGAAFAVLLSEVIGPPGGRLASAPIGALRAAARWLRVKRNRMAITGRAHADGRLGSIGGLEAKLERAKTLRLSVVAPKDNERTDAQFADGVAVQWVADVRAARRELYRTDPLRSTVLAIGMVAVVALSGFWLYGNQRVDRKHAQAVAASRQIVAEANSIAAGQPGLARQLLVEAYRVEPTDEALGALVNSSALPGVLHIPGLKAVRFAPNRAMLAVSTDSGIRLINPETGGLISTLPRGDADNGALAFSPDGHTLAAGGREGSVHLWDVTDPSHPRVLNELNWDDDGVAEELAFTPDGRALVMSTDTRRIRIWNVVDPLSAAQVATVTGTEDGLGDAPMSLSPDGRTIAAGGPGASVRLWDITDHTRPRKLAVLRGHTGGVAAVRFSPGGHLLASGGIDDTVRLWDVTSRTRPKALGPLSGHTFTVSALAFSTDGHILASAAGDDPVRLWNVADPLRPKGIGALTGQAATSPFIDFSSDRRTIAGTADGDILRLWHVADPGASVPLTELADAASPVAYRPDGKVLLTTGGDHSVRLWDVRDISAPMPLGRLTGHTYVITNAVFSPNGETVATSSVDFTTRLWDVRDTAHPRALATFGSQEEPVGDAAFSADGRLLAAEMGDGVRLWDVTDPARPKADGSIAATGVAQFRPGGHELLTRGDDKHPPRLWDIRNPRRPRPGAVIGKSGVGTIAFSPDGRTLLTGQPGDTARLWHLDDPAHPSPGATLTGTGTVNAAAFSTDGRLLATTGPESQIRIWNVADTNHPTNVTALTGRPALLTPANTLAFSPDGRSLATGGDGIALWDLSPTDLMHRICTESGDPITLVQWRQYVRRDGFTRPCQTPGNEAGTVPPEVPGPPSPTATKPPSTAPRQSPSAGAALVNMKRYDWANAELPAPFCSISGTVRFKNKEATAPSSRWGRVHLSQYGKVYYGDLLGNGHPVAAIPLQCDNGGGTGDAEIAAADIIVDGSSGKITLIGAVTPQQPSATVTTNIGKVEITRGRMTVHEIWYRPADFTCCASGTAVTDWTYTDGKLIPGSPHITE
ncbi:MAG: WD40 repeat domain-containing protein [Actinoallomurus sp.]